MCGTLSYHKLNVRCAEEVIKETSENIIKYYNNLLQCKAIKLNKIFVSRRLNKFRKGQLNTEKAKDDQLVILERYPILSTESLFISHK